MSYKQKPIKDEPLPLSERIKTLQQAYDKAGLEYVKNSADYKEMEFLDAVARRPDTHRKYVTSIYRLKTEKRFIITGDGTTDEVLVYHMKEEVMNHSDQYLAVDNFKGYWWNVDTRFNKDLQGQTSKVQVLGEFPQFLIPFSPQAVEDIIDYSLLDVSQFYVGYASTRGPNITTGDLYAIKNKDDFKHGTFQELMDIGRYNFSTIDPALIKWRQEGETLKKQSQTITSLQSHTGRGGQKSQ